MQIRNGTADHRLPRRMGADHQIIGLEVEVPNHRSVAWCKGERTLQPRYRVAGKVLADETEKFTDPIGGELSIDRLWVGGSRLCVPPVDGRFLSHATEPERRRSRSFRTPVPHLLARIRGRELSSQIPETFLVPRSHALEVGRRLGRSGQPADGSTAKNRRDPAVNPTRVNQKCRGVPLRTAWDRLERGLLDRGEKGGSVSLEMFDISLGFHRLSVCSTSLQPGS